LEVRPRLAGQSSRALMWRTLWARRSGGARKGSSLSAINLTMPIFMAIQSACR
jgi:hypothetical protein